MTIQDFSILRFVFSGDLAEWLFCLGTFLAGLGVLLMGAGFLLLIIRFWLQR